MAVEGEIGTAGKGGIAKVSDQEKGPKQPVPSLREILDKTFDENIAGIIRCIFFNVVELNNLGQAKFLIDFMTLMRSGKNIPAAEYTAFAETLKEKFLEAAEMGSEKERNEKQSQGGTLPVTDAQA